MQSDPHELHSLIGMPDHADKAKQLLSALWQRVVITGDDALACTSYPPYRIAAAGPHGSS